MWKVLILGTLASILVAGCQSAATPTVTVSTATPLPVDTPTATSTVVPTPTSTPVPTPTAIGHDSLTVADESSGGCNEDFVGLGEPVLDAINETNDLMVELLYLQAVSRPYDLPNQQSALGDRVALVWNGVAVDTGEGAKYSLGQLADLWQRIANISLGDLEALIVGYSSIIEEYEGLAGEFEKCDPSSGVADELLFEAQLFQQLTDDLKRGP